MKLSIKSVKDAIDWRIRELLGNDSVDRAICILGLAWRPVLRNSTFFGIAGSVGKTTAKDLLVGILSKKGRVVGNILSLNVAPEIAKIVLRVRPWHGFCVAELGETKPGSLDGPLALLRPSIAIVTTIGDDHISAFGSRDAIASEIVKVVHSIPSSGTVVLNLDDERVAQMADGMSCRVITYGVFKTADLRAGNIVSVWPDPLLFTATYNGDSVAIRTQLYGQQLLTSALAAIGGGLAAGLSLAECAEGIAKVPPAEGRAQLVRCEQGITFIRDDFKASYPTIQPLLDQLATAKAKRKIVVLGSISDIRRKKEREYHRIANKALEVADIVIFAGGFASYALKARQPDNERRLLAFTSIRDACLYVQSICQEGDLIVLKGTNPKDHLDRIRLSFDQQVHCWIDDCQRPMFCSECSHLGKHRGLPEMAAAECTRKDSGSPGLPSVGQRDQVIIGLGNPGAEYAETPHNVGYETLDVLCNSLGIEWQDFPEAWIAGGTIKDQDIWLIKVKSPMNLTGQGLNVLADAMGFTSEQCILVFDDVDLPLGKVKTKMNGSSGGHRGVASVLDFFQTDKIRRVKIGITAGEKEAATAENVLRQFSAEDQEKIKPALQFASARIVELVSS